jgi:hypothetical protein
MQPGIEEEYKKQTVKKRSVGARAIVSSIPIYEMVDREG